MILVVAAAFLGSATAATVEVLPHGNLLKVEEQREGDGEGEGEEEGGEGEGDTLGEGMETAFKTFIQKHHREYKHGTAEHSMRKGLFQQRLAAVHAHNAKPGTLWKAAPSHFSDRTEAERKAVLGYRKHARVHAKGHAPASLLESSNKTMKLPKSKSWAHLKCAHKVRDQGSCGSCWAVATMSALEAHHEIYNKEPRTFSAQQIIECTLNPRACGGTGGCEGATVELGMDYVLKNGLATEEQHPYHGQDSSCSAEKKKKDLMQSNAGNSFGLMSYKTLDSNVARPLLEAVAHVGPVAVSAGASSWFEYNSGVFDGCSKDTVIDHAITLYGYGVDHGKKYWLIRNSWGPGWGEDGFIRLLRHNEDEKHCGTDDNNQEGVGCKGDPTSVTVCGMCGILYDSVVPYFKGSPGHSDSGALDEDETPAKVSKFVRSEAQ